MTIIYNSEDPDGNSCVLRTTHYDGNLWYLLSDDEGDCVGVLPEEMRAIAIAALEHLDKKKATEPLDVCSLKHGVWFKACKEDGQVEIHAGGGDAARINPEQSEKLLEWLTAHKPTFRDIKIGMLKKQRDELDAQIRALEARG